MSGSSASDLHDLTLPSNAYPPVRDMCRQIFVSETIGYHTIWTTLMGRLIDNTPPTSDFRSLWFSPNLVLNRGASRQVGRPPICPRCSAVCSNCCKCVTFGAGVATVYYPTASANTSTFLRNHTPIIYLLSVLVSTWRLPSPSDVKSHEDETILRY
ncbi:hypothetical protein FS749_005615 [Ceratobasidium sp. UAMH 11750]|nr:hypothetical protein FS749_005615 [Ceratobasidium sp. UAMH 11750]